MNIKLIIIIGFIALLINISAPYQDDSDEGENSRDDIEDIDLEDENDDEEDCSPNLERGLIAANLFPDGFSREDALKILKKAVDILEQPHSSAKRPCRIDPAVDIDAKNLLRFLTDDPSIGSTTEEEVSQESSNCPSQSSSTGFQPEPEYQLDSKTSMTERYMRGCMKLHEAKWSERSIRGKYSKFRRQYVPRIRRYLAAGGTREFRYREIDEYVMRRVNESLAAGLPIHEYHLREWGFERALQLKDNSFKGSNRWVTNIKKKTELVSRKVTNLSSRPERENANKKEMSIVDFYEDYREVAQYFPHHRILNVDQSGLKYEISNIRSLGRRGARDHILNIDSANNNQHSYTVQPIIGRDGRLVGKVLVCFREQSDHFGPRVEANVRNLEAELGNLVVVASTSGKMSRNLTNEWINRVLEPLIPTLEAMDQSELIGSQDTIISEAPGPSWASDPPETWTPEQQRIMRLRNSSPAPRRQGLMVLMDSWGGHSSNLFAEQLYARNIFVLRIPPGTTAELQPLDVQIFRQYKILVKRILEAIAYEGNMRSWTDRYGIMRMQSIIWHQLRAPAYQEMFTWAWRKTDPDYRLDVAVPCDKPDMVINTQFKFDRRKTCEIDGCNKRAFI